jgi:hypothetical protein
VKVGAPVDSRRLDTGRSTIMKAAPGDWLMIEGTHLADRKRRGRILEVHGADGSPPYVVRWDDTDTETLVVPTVGAHIFTAEQMRQTEDH